MDRQTNAQRQKQQAQNASKLLFRAISRDCTFVDAGGRRSAVQYPARRGLIQRWTLTSLDESKLCDGIHRTHVLQSAGRINRLLSAPARLATSGCPMRSPPPPRTIGARLLDNGCYRDGVWRPSPFHSRRSSRGALPVA